MRPTTADDLFSLRFPASPKWAPAGKRAACIVAQANREANRYERDLWLIEAGAAPGSPRRLTTSGRVQSYAWLDDETILWIASQEESRSTEREIRRIRVDGGESQTILTVGRPLASIYLLDQSRLLVTARVACDLALNAACEPPDDAHKDDPVIVDELPFWANGEGFINKTRTRLSILGLGDGGLTDISDQMTDVESFDVCGDLLCFVGARYTERRPIKNSIYLARLDRDKPAPEELHLSLPGSNAALDPSMPRFVSDEQIVVFVTDQERYGINENPHLAAIRVTGLAEVGRTDSAAGARVSGWTDLGEASLGNRINSDARLGCPLSVPPVADGGTIAFVATAGVDSHVYRADPTGGRPVTSAAGSVDAFDLCDDRLLFVAMRGNAPPELYFTEVDGTREPRERQVSEFNTGLRAELGLAQLVPISALCSDRTRIGGYVMMPPGASANASLPGVLCVHGGPKTAYGSVFFHELQLLVAAGLAVFFCNPRGSAGRGDEFADIRGRYGTVDAKDLLAFTDAVLQHYPQIDPARLGISGGSYGGFMTNWMIGHTDRFAAAVSQRSISDWRTFFGTSDIGYSFGPDQVGGDPWSEREQNERASPLAYADKARTPTLFIHASADYRCWIQDGLAMFTALKYFGVETRLVWFPNANHELSRSGAPRARIQRLDEIVSWLKTHLGLQD